MLVLRELAVSARRAGCRAVWRSRPAVRLAPHSTRFSPTRTPRTLCQCMVDSGPRGVRAGKQEAIAVELVRTVRLVDLKTGCSRAVWRVAEESNLA